VWYNVAWGDGQVTRAGLGRFGLGISLLYRSWMGLVGTLAFCALVFFLIRDEEALVHQEFGAEWEPHCQRSWRLIPFVY
jgi:protein-S-isoprenylcysteine O-methyltransferase Ste14